MRDDMAVRRIRRAVLMMLRSWVHSSCGLEIREHSVDDPVLEFSLFLGGQSRVKSVKVTGKSEWQIVQEVTEWIQAGVPARPVGERFVTMVEDEPDLEPGTRRITLDDESEDS